MLVVSGFDEVGGGSLLRCWVVGLCSIGSEVVAVLLLVWREVLLVLIVAGYDEVGGGPLLRCWVVGLCSIESEFVAVLVLVW